MTNKDLETLKKWGFKITKGKIWIEITFKANYGLVELTVQTDQLKNTTFYDVIDKVFKNGYVEGERSGQRSIQERIKGVLNITS